MLELANSDRMVLYILYEAIDESSEAERREFALFAATAICCAEKLRDSMTPFGFLAGLFAHEPLISLADRACDRTRDRLIAFAKTEDRRAAVARAFVDFRRLVAEYNAGKKCRPPATTVRQ